MMKVFGRACIFVIRNIVQTVGWTIGLIANLIVAMLPEDFAADSWPVQKARSAVWYFRSTKWGSCYCWASREGPWPSYCSKCCEKEGRSGVIWYCGNRNNPHSMTYRRLRKESAA